MHDIDYNVLLQYSGIYEKANIGKLKALVYALKREGMGLSLDPFCRKKLISDTGPCLEG